MQTKARTIHSLSTKVLPPLGSYVTRLFFAINGATRVHEDELVKRLDNEVEVSIETDDK